MGVKWYVVFTILRALFVHFVTKKHKKTQKCARYRTLGDFFEKNVSRKKGLKVGCWGLNADWRVVVWNVRRVSG